MKLSVLENGRIGFKADERPVWFGGGFPILLPLENPLFEGGLDIFAPPMAADEKILGQGIDGFGANAVEADAKLENVIVVLGASINLRDTVDHFAQRNAPSEVIGGANMSRPPS